jgi:hypothetical protein
MRGNGFCPFRPEEATLFFGSDEHISEPRNRLLRRKCWRLVGVSGCDKSSLVEAGMVPTLEMGLAADPEQRSRGQHAAGRRPTAGVRVLPLPTSTAGPVLRAQLTDRLVTGIPTSE